MTAPKPWCVIVDGKSEPWLFMYDYHESSKRRDRELSGTDRCGSTGPTYSLSQLVLARRMTDPQSNQPLSPSSPFIYAVAESGEIRVAPDGDRDTPNSVKHETLFHNAPVRAAGEIHIRDGQIIHVNDHSGSYQTYGALHANPAFAQARLQAFDGLLTASEELRLLRLAWPDQ